MKKTSRSLLGFALILAFCFAMTAGVCATTLDDLREEQAGIKNKIDNAEDELSGVRAQRLDTLSQIDELEAKLTELGAEIDTLQAQLAQAEQDLATQQQEYETIEANLTKSQEKMRDRVNGIYVNGDISYVDVLLSAETFSDFLSNFTFYEKIIEQDQATITSIRENKQLAREKLDELAATKAQIETLTNSKLAQEQEYQAQAEQKSALVASLEEEAETLEASLAQFEEDSQEIAAKISAISNSGGINYTGNGQFGWPLAGHTRVSSYFGGRVHPITGRYSNHTGIDIPAPSGTPIAAAEAGTVVYKGYMSAYGNCVLINHGDGYATFYAHLSSFAVSGGQSVARGQTVGGVGTTGWSTGNHLHFEVRINGNPQNPLNYATPV